MATKKEEIAAEVARAVGAGKPVALETVDFSDPNRPKTCLEVDFPILAINSLSAIEASSGGTKKPIYQMSKWWARRQPSVFRSMLIAAATKAPDDPSQAAKIVWDNYYANHQKKGAFKGLNVADIFMGGGTTLVEGSRLGMQMTGNDLNPVAWFVVKQEFADVDLEEVKGLLADIEAEVKPQIMPYFACDGPNGEKGIWTHLPTGKVMPEDFDPLRIPREKRKDYAYEGPEIIYTFWDKHGPCQITGCGHYTPIITRPVMAVKSMSVKSWNHTCFKCVCNYDIEESEARMAPDVPLVVASDEKPFTPLAKLPNPSGRQIEEGLLEVICPHCGVHSKARMSPKEGLVIEGEKGQSKLGKGKNKKVELSLLVHPQWLRGSAKIDAQGRPFGGSAQDDVESTQRWNNERAEQMRLLEVRGNLPDQVTCPETKVTFSTIVGTVPKNSHYVCGACGNTQDVLTTVKATKKTGPMAGYAVQAFSPQRKQSGAGYNGRYFSPFGTKMANQYNAAVGEWNERKEEDLKDFWPKSELPYGFMTHHLQGGVPNHGYTHWWTMFNPRQLLVHSLLLKSVMTVGKYRFETREYVLATFQQYLRNQCLFTIWNIQADQLEPMFSNNNYHPKSTVVENCVFASYGRGNWLSCTSSLSETDVWKKNPWETVSKENTERVSRVLADHFTGKSAKVWPGDSVGKSQIHCCSSTELNIIDDSSLDLVITDPPFGGLLHYSELSDFFYVWLQLALKDRYPNYFAQKEDTPKALEAVANRAREPEDPDGFYKRLLTDCWREAHRTLKPGGILAFTFHHSEDDPWVAVLESLFDAGFYLEATYPIRSDETKGDGEFGSRTIEYDIIHVCRKRTEEPTPVSWGRMRREVLEDVRQLKAMLENHKQGGLPAADLQVIRRGKALEYFSRHYGKVYVDEVRPISVKDAIVGINQLIDEDANRVHEPAPVIAEPMTRQFLRVMFASDESDRVWEGDRLGLKREAMQKYLRGSGVAPDEFEKRGWCKEESKVFYLCDPLEFARDWHGRQKRNLTTDLDQTLVMVGACMEGSGINIAETLKNKNFKPHPALKSLLEWLIGRASHPNLSKMKLASTRALSIYNRWANENQDEVKQMSLFLEEAAG